MTRNNGFSLIEIAIVLFIISLLIGHLLTPISTQIDLRRYKQTQKTLEEIKEALLGFASIHGRLPYPASNQKTGRQDSTLYTKEGYLPWADLGVGRVDAWGNPFRYRAEDDQKIFWNGSELRVKDNLTTNSGDSRVAAIILSTGKNGVPEEENGNQNKIFMYDVDIDDILTWLSRNTLVNRLYATGQLPPE